MNRPAMAGPVLPFGPRTLPPGVRMLMLLTAFSFVLQRLFALSGGPTAWDVALSLSPSTFFAGRVWQPLTYMLLHAELMHLLGNLFVLWMFGAPLEERIGRRRLALLWFGAGAAAGLGKCLLAGASVLAVPASAPLSMLLPGWSEPTLGASGGAFALLAAFGRLIPAGRIHAIILPFTFDARLLLPLSLALSLDGLGPTDDTVHLLGGLAGLLLLRFGFRSRSPAPPRPRPRPPLRMVRGGADDGTFH
jgi:membrane associated rhomboid family serine protease